MSSSNWKTYKLSEIMEIIGGGTPKTTMPQYWNGDIPWLSVVDFGGEKKFVYETEKTITKSGLENSSTNVLNKGSIIISARGTVGELAVLGKDMAFNQSCYGINAKDTTSNEFLYYLLKQNIQELRRKTHGAVFDTITRETFEHINVNLPPFPIQRRIADILSALDEKIELNRQTNATLESIARAFFREWFTENENVKQWKEIPLPEAIDFLEGPGIRNWQYTNSDEGTRFINIRCIQNRDVNIETANRINAKDVITKYQHFLLQKDDIVVSTSGTLGRFAVIRDEHLPLLLNTSVIRMRPIEGISTWSYLIGYIESEEFQFELESRATGSVQKNFGPMHLKQMKILIPPLHLLKEFEKIVQPLHRRILHNFSETSALASLRNTLLPKLMSGEIGV